MLECNEGFYGPDCKIRLVSLSMSCYTGLFLGACSLAGVPVTIAVKMANALPSMVRVCVQATGLGLLVMNQWIGILM